MKHLILLILLFTGLISNTYSQCNLTCTQTISTSSSTNLTFSSSSDVICITNGYTGNITFGFGMVTGT